MPSTIDSCSPSTNFNCAKCGTTSMIGSSVVPGLPKRCVTPSSTRSCRSALRPLMRGTWRGPVRVRAGSDDRTHRGQQRGTLTCPHACPKHPLDRSGDVTQEALFEVGDETFRRLVESAQDYAIFLLTPAGFIATWNLGAQRIKGYSASEAIGQHFSVFYTPDALARGWPDEELRRALAEGRLEDEGWRVRKDGTRFWANVIISPLRGDDGRLLGFSKITRDLTQRLRLETLEHEGQRVSRFIAMLSHELRSPLAAIQQAAAILQLDPAKAGWCGSIINRQVHHLRRLVDDLLDVSRISTGKIQFQRALIDF